MIDKIEKYFSNDEIVKADGFDDAIIGIDEVDQRLIYSISKCLEILEKDFNMNETDAIEYFNFNVSSAYVGKKTPIWCIDYL